MLPNSLFRAREFSWPLSVNALLSGVTGPSVESAEGLSVEELAAAIPHCQIGVTTVGAIRAAGGDVVRTSGRSPHHATLVGLDPEEASRLLTPTIANPATKP